MNEQFQEKLWSVCRDLLKDWMSPEIWSKHSTPSQHTESSNSDGAGCDWQDNDYISGQQRQVTSRVTTTNHKGNKPVGNKFMMMSCYEHVCGDIELEIFLYINFK